MEVKEVTNDITKFLAGLVGVGVGQLAMSFIPSTKIELADKLLPGAVGLAGAAILAAKSKNAYAKSAAFGLGIAGTANIINKFTAGKSGILAKVNQATALPTASLKGFGYGAAQVMGYEPQASPVMGVGSVPEHLRLVA